MLPFDGGVAIEVDALLKRITAARQRHQIEGITLLGGEPFAHAGGAAAIAAAVQRAGLSVMIFSGFELHQLQRRQDPQIDALLACTDILVDGPYRQGQPDSTRRWIGSTNQQIHFLSTRYSAQDRCWSEPNTLEIRMHGGEMTVNGFPAAKSKAFWSRSQTHPG
jgi:anaerobic ribonucleoside-triphosphate reductase activating protein